MIDIAVKHFILEYCITQLFSTISRNFAIPKNLLSDLEIGKIYSKVVFTYSSGTYGSGILVNEMGDDNTTIFYTKFQLIKITSDLMHIKYATKTVYYEDRSPVVINMSDWYGDLTHKCIISSSDIVDSEIFE